MVDQPAIEHMLTTLDNPFDPFTQYDAWAAWDIRAGYHLPGLLARIVITSNDLSEADQSLAIEEAIDELIKYNGLAVLAKVQAGEVLSDAWQNRIREQSAASA